jgi:thermostable 8-oxoguanine DNA glycosylase
MTKNLVIDDSFMEIWCPKYDCSTVGGDDKKYDVIIKDVEKENVSQIGILSEKLFRKIYKWKAARAMHHVNFSKFDDYNMVFKQTIVQALESPEQTVKELDNLPGIGIPVASTILHFINPEDFPIIDFRTIEILQEADYLDKSMDYYRDTSRGYCEFREVILDIAKKYTEGDIRKVDKALFAYHKLCFSSKKKI